jgi:pimeloyl-ACP methyl ester carboxylesterase
MSPEGNTMTPDPQSRTSSAADDTIYLDRPGGRIAYEVMGDGPLVVLSPGLADVRSTYRFLAPLIAEAGFRVARVDLRGHGDSSTGWDSYSRTDTAGDLIDVVRGLGGPAVIVGQSFSGGSATIAAATAPDLVSAIVGIAPFTRPPKFNLGAMLSNDHDYRRGALLPGTGPGGRKRQDLGQVPRGRLPGPQACRLGHLAAGAAGEPG